ncbi:MAG: hypothetical protein ACK5LC_17915 [Coprobacillaceae bacterium]
MKLLSISKKHKSICLYITVCLLLLALVSSFRALNVSKQRCELKQRLNEISIEEYSEDIHDISLSTAVLDSQRLLHA